MAKRKIPMPDFSASRAEAGEVLSQDGNRQKLIEAIIVCAFSFYPAVLLSDFFQNVWTLSEQLDPSSLKYSLFSGAFDLLAVLFLLFLSAPICVGLFGMAAQMEQGKETFLRDLFLPFSSRKAYRTAFRLGIRAAVWLAVLTATVTLTVQFFSWITDSVWLAAILCVLSLIAEFLLWLRVCSSSSTVLFHLFSERMQLRDARRRARTFRKAAKKGTARFLLGFLPWLLLSLLTVCILLLADVLPRMLIAYFRYCRHLVQVLPTSDEQQKGNNNE